MQFASLYCAATGVTCSAVWNVLFLTHTDGRAAWIQYQAVARHLQCNIRQSQDIWDAATGSRKTSRMHYQAVARHLKCAIRQSQDISNAVSGSRKTSSYTNLVKNSDRIIMTRAGFESVIVLIVLIQLSICIHSYKRRREVYTSGQLKWLIIEPNSWLYAGWLRETGVRFWGKEVIGETKT